MKIIKSNAVSLEETEKIRELESACIKEDSLESSLFLSTEINYDREIPVFFSAYEGEKLVGFLTIFIPTKEEAEISAIVHPDYRRKGIFTKLDEVAREIISENKIGRILYCVETKSKSAGEVLRQRKIEQIIRSEYRMEAKEESILKDFSAASGIYSERANPKNIKNYLEITESAFGEGDSGYSDTIMSSKTRLGYVLYKDETPVGVFVIGLEEEGKPFIYGVAVKKDERGKGYGKALMGEACKIGFNYGKTLQLDVDSENPVAFNLYKKMGFKITFQMDYYIG